MNRILLALCAWALTAQSLQAEPADTLVLHSGSLQTPLIELYTSEGCSSCPPADRWLQSLADKPGLWSSYVPIAFHVTYWNYLGWKDRFAQAPFDQRQRKVAAQASSGVYTPGIFLQGREWRSWRARPEAHDQLSRPSVGTLQAKISCEDARFTFTPAADYAGAQPRQVELAWLHPSQRSQVTRGENRGRELTHDFVVARYARQTLRRDKTDDRARWSANIQPRCDALSQPWAVAAWVSDAKGTPLQAVGGPLPAGFVGAASGGG